MDPSVTETPKYVWLKKELEGQIKKLHAGGGNCLPTERALCQQYGLSRVTVRRALEELEKEGAIRRIQGKGAFLSREKIQQPLVHLSSFSEDMRARNMTAGAKVLALETLPASDLVAENLHVGVGSPVLMLKRLRLANTQPMAIETCYLIDSVGSVIKDVITDNESLYDLLFRSCGVKVVSANQSIGVGLLQPWERSLLGEEVPAYALCMTRQTMDQTDRVVEFTQSKYRSDSYSYHINFRIKAE